MKLINFPVAISEGLEISWHVCDKVGDAIVRIKRGDIIVDMPAIQALEAMSGLSCVIFEALEYCVKNNCVSTQS